MNFSTSTFRLISIVVIVMICSSVRSQTHNLEGHIIDDKSKSPVPYANIGIINYSLGTSSNHNGTFELKFPDSLMATGILKISSIGYESYTIPLSAIKKDSLDITLKPVAYTIPKVIVTAKKHDPEKIFREALKRIKDNYANEPYLANCFYRHYCKENGKYGRLIEAAFDVYDDKGHHKLYRKPDDKVQVRVNQLRRSYDFTSYFSDHTPIALYGVLNNDITSYNSPLTNYKKHAKKPGRRYTYSMEGITAYDNQEVFVIGFSWQDSLTRVQDTPGGNRKHHYLKYQFGKIFINRSDYAILRVEDSSRTIWTNYENGIWQDEWDLSLGHWVSYRKIHGKYHMQLSGYKGDDWAKKMDSTGTKMLSRNHLYHIEMMVNDVKQENLVPFTGREPNKLELMKMDYQPAFWDSYNVLKATPLEEKIEADLSERLALEEQFANYNEKAFRVMEYDSLKYLELIGLLRKFKGSVIYIDFWASWCRPCVEEIPELRTLMKKYFKRQVIFVLVSIDEDESKYLEANKKYFGGKSKTDYWKVMVDGKAVFVPKHSVGEHIRTGLGWKSKICRNYEVTEIPRGILIDHKGNIVDANAPRPSDPALEIKIKELLKELKDSK